MSVLVQIARNKLAEMRYPVAVLLSAGEELGLLDERPFIDGERAQEEAAIERLLSEGLVKSCLLPPQEQWLRARWPRREEAGPDEAAPFSCRCYNYEEFLEQLVVLLTRLDELFI